MFTPDTSKIPSNPGVYLFKDRKDTILYIGKAKNLQKRLGQYFSPNSLRKQEMLSKATKVDFLTVKNESEALYLEDNLIKQHQPFYNNLLKADNSYTYIKITKEQFPQILLTKRRINDGSMYIGPKNDTIQLKKFLQYLRQILKFRGCKATQFKQGKLCSDYYFGLCRGRCKEPMKSKPEEYKDILNIITSFFKGNTKPIEKEIHEQIEAAITHENFEWAAQLRDIYNSLQGFVEKQDVVLTEKKDGYLAVIKSIGAQFIERRNENLKSSEDFHDVELIPTNLDTSNSNEVKKLKISKSGRYIYTVLVFTQGKLVDVITSKEQQTDIEEDSLELAIQRTFGEGKVEKNKKEIHIVSKSFSKLGKKTEKELWKLAENFLESYIISQSMQEGTIIINDMVKTLKDRYGLKKIPYKIECMDISHLSGGRTSGGLSCLVGGLPYVKGYRRYKIQAKKSDDYEALQEILKRRVKNGGELPDLLILDGGKGQLGVVKKLCKESEWKKIVSQIDIISLGKGEARNKTKIGNSLMKGQIGEKIYTLDEKLKIHEIAIVYDQADKILLKARDEAHRFANSYRKKQMSQEFKTNK